MHKFNYQHFLAFEHYFANIYILYGHKDKATTLQILHFTHHTN